MSKMVSKIIYNYRIINTHALILQLAICLPPSGGDILVLPCLSVRPYVHLSHVGFCAISSEIIQLGYPYFACSFSTTRPRMSSYMVDLGLFSKILQDFECLKSCIIWNNSARTSMFCMLFYLVRPSVRISLCSSVCLSVHPSICHTLVSLRYLQKLS